MTEAVGAQDFYCQAGVVSDNSITVKQVQKLYSEVTTVFHCLESTNFY